MSMPDVEKYLTETAPPLEVVSMLEAGQVAITRRIEILEADGETEWSPSGDDKEIVSRLIDGTVTVDYNSDERRKLDLRLENIDNALRPDPTGGLWYDKIIKVYRGVEYLTASAPATAAIISDVATNNEMIRLSQTFSMMGYNTVMEKNSRDVMSLSRYTVVVAFTNATTPHSYADTVLAPLVAMGKIVVTIGACPVGSLPHYTSGVVQDTQGIWTVTSDNPAFGSFTTESVPSPGSTTIPAGVRPGVQRLAAWPTTATPGGATAALIRNVNGGFWLDLHINNTWRPQATSLLARMMSYMRTHKKYTRWETPLGEFMIDGLNTQNFPDDISVTGRDFTKKMIGDKLSKNVTFIAGTPLRDIVIGQAALSGIPTSKMLLEIGDEVITTEMSFQRGATRWEIIKSALESYGYERYFNARGQFVARKFLDPSTSPASWRFGTGPDGNLVTYQRSVNDSMIFNKVIVTATPSEGDTGSIGYFAEAEVTDPASPVHKNRIGTRTETLDADWLNSDEACLELAKSRLKISALEPYQLDFASIYYPWLEVGEVVVVDEPDALPHEPNRFLLDGLTYGLGLGPMSATGKRVTFVANNGGLEQ